MTQTGRERQKGVQGGYSAAGAKGRGWRFLSSIEGQVLGRREIFHMSRLPTRMSLLFSPPGFFYFYEAIFAEIVGSPADINMVRF